MKERFRETTIKVNGFTLYVYTSTFLPIKPYWHTLLTSLYVYCTFKDCIHITFKEAYKLVKSTRNTEKKFWFKNK